MNFDCDVCKSKISIESLGFLGNINDECNPYSELECLCKKCLVEKFEILLFDNEYHIPINRLKDYNWLSLNISINNIDNKSLIEAKVYIKAILDNVIGNKKH